MIPTSPTRTPNRLSAPLPLSALHGGIQDLQARYL